jgi:hypothetical protein
MAVTSKVGMLTRNIIRITEPFLSQCKNLLKIGNFLLGINNKIKSSKSEEDR